MIMHIIIDTTSKENYRKYHDIAFIRTIYPIFIPKNIIAYTLYKSTTYYMKIV